MVGLIVTLCTGVFVFGVLIGVAALMLHGLVLQNMWAWFVVPIFKLPNLTLVQAIGLAMVINLVVNRSIGTVKFTNQSTKEVMMADNPWYANLAMIWGPLIIWGEAWILHHFFM